MAARTFRAVLILAVLAGGPAPAAATEAYAGQFALAFGATRDRMASIEVRDEQALTVEGTRDKDETCVFAVAYLPQDVVLVELGCAPATVAIDDVLAGGSATGSFVTRTFTCTDGCVEGVGRATFDVTWGEASPLIGECGGAVIDSRTSVYEGLLARFSGTIETQSTGALSAQGNGCMGYLAGTPTPSAPPD